MLPKQRPGTVGEPVELDIADALIHDSACNQGIDHFGRRQRQVRVEAPTADHDRYGHTYVAPGVQV